MFVGDDLVILIEIVPYLPIVSIFQTSFRTFNAISLLTQFKMLINPKHVVALLVEKITNYGQENDGETPDDEIFADLIFDIIIKQATGQCEFSEEDILYNEQDSETDDSDTDEDSDQTPEEGSASSAYEPSPQKSKRTPMHEQFDEQTRSNIVEYFEKYGQTATLKRYKSFKNDSKKLRRLIDQHKTAGSRDFKLLQVKNIFYEQFKDRRDRLISVHDWDLKKWALEAAKQVSLDNFKAERGFILNFKKSHRITSRRITKFVTEKTLEDDAVTQKKGKEFNYEVIRYKKDNQMDHSRVLNTDQSGFNYEMVSSRTLSTTGEKDTLGNIQSMNAMTHSYTLQVLISNAGDLAPKLLLCLQEPSGCFGPRVVEEVRKATSSNVYVTCSKSGKMDKSTLKEWIKNCLDPVIIGPTLLIQDSWGAQRDKTLFNESLTDPSLLEMMTIPPKATKYIQPLDVYFFRQYKLLARRLTDAIRGTGGEEKLRSRSIIIALHSFIYNQLSSDIFRPMLVYAWQSAGYDTPFTVTSFDNVLKISLSIGFEGCSGIGNSNSCPESAILRCVYCKSFLCARHCVAPLHYHDQARSQME